MSRAPDAGFTLIETLVALAILALSAVAILGAAQAHVARVAALEVRAAAGWTVQNHLAERALGLPSDTAPAPVLGHAFRLDEVRSPTADPDLMRLDVTAHGADGGPVARLTGFVAVDGGGS